MAQNSTAVLKVNNLSVRLNSNGFISDSLSSPALFTAAGLSLLNNAGVWMAAKDSNGNLRVAAHSVLINSHEFWSGPLELSNEKPANQAAWDRVYPMYSSDIAYHRAHFRDQGYSTPAHLINWPGSLGLPFTQVLAPFVDYQNNNRIYEPVDGDFPYIQGEGLLYSISNDRYSSNHSYSKGLPLGVELHASVFAYQQDTTLQNCLIVRYSVFNRSPRDYKNFRFASVLNFGIGSLENEYLGTEVGSKALYAYNDTTEATFSGRLVSLGCMAINRNISSTMYFENTADPINGRPDSAAHFYHLMQGKWKNGQTLNYGSNGVDGSGTANYIYPDTTDASHGGFRWLDQVPGKKIGVLSFDSVELKSQTALNFELVYFYVDQKFDNLKQIGQYCSSIKQGLNRQKLLQLVEKEAENQPLNYWYPNPVKIGEKIKLHVTLESPKAIRLINSEGKIIDNLDLDMNDNSIILPLSLKQGVYIIEFKTLNTIRYQKLILNN